MSARFFCVVMTAVAAISGACGSARANLIFDAGVTNVIATNFDDHNPVNIVLPSTFTLFGVSQSQIRVGSNGAFGIPSGLNGTQYDSSQNPWHNTGAGKPIIAPLWDDLNSGPGGLVSGVSKIGATTFSNSFSITAPNSFSYGGGNSTAGGTIGYQVSLFTGPETVTLTNGNMFNFLAGDIAFSYQNNTLSAFAGGSAAVGITDGAGIFVGMPGSSAGVLSTANRGLLPTGESFVLFRSNGAGSYNASIASFASSSTASVPEPASVAILSLLGLAATARRSSRCRVN